jgi:hypothetical protein
MEWATHILHKKTRAPNDLILKAFWKMRGNLKGKKEGKHYEK